MNILSFIYYNTDTGFVKNMTEQNLYIIVEKNVAYYIINL